jgi:hypothetical protein
MMSLMRSLRYILFTGIISLTGIASGANHEIPKIKRGDYLVIGQVKDWHGSIIKYVKSPMHCASFRKTGLQLRFSYILGYATLNFYPSGRYVAIQKTSSGITVRNGTWRRPPNGPIITDSKDSNHIHFREKINLSSNNTGNVISGNFYVERELQFLFFTKLRR